MKALTYFIERPVTTILLTGTIILSGLLGLHFLPVAPLPQIDYPVISVSAILPGADPETMAAAVTTPLEQRLGRIAAVNEITSSSSLGKANVSLQFDLERDINGAARDVQAAINAAQSMLPTALPSLPNYRKFNPADLPIMILALTSETHSRGILYDFASTLLAQKISQIDGVGTVTVSGSSPPAVRVAVKQDLLSSLGLSFERVRQAITNANLYTPQGAVSDDKQHWQIATNNALLTAKDYCPLIIAQTANGEAVRLQDIAEVTDAVQDIRNAGFFGNKEAVLIIIRRETGANIIATIERITTQLPLLRTMMPANINIEVAQERSASIKASLHEVKQALLFSVVSVILVIFFCLHSVRATLIPALAIPVSLIGTFAVMYLCGFSINNLSLMALAIGTGFVVDDAIVVVENTVRHLEQGVKPLVAALKGMQEVSFTLLIISSSLVAVFIPLLFMQGMIGRLLREFSITLSIAILISLLVSLTLAPMLCAHLLHTKEKYQPVQRKKDFFKIMRHFYQKTLRWSLQHAQWVMLSLVMVIALNIWLYGTIAKTLFPEQDTGRLQGVVQIDQDSSFQLMRKKLTEVIAVINAQGIMFLQ